jgi:predicted DCC family thiol-disulfide oxidoreductase YuxK
VSPSWVDGTALARVLNNPLARPTIVRDLAVAMPAVVLRFATWGALALELAYAPLALVRLDDGTCGLCHRATRFVLSEDRRGNAFIFAPLQGDAFAAMIASEDRSALPDSVIVRTEAGELLTRSDAVIYTLQRLGGLWRVIAIGMQIIPQGLRNRAYDYVARIRYRVFARAQTVCPILPSDLRSRFQA